MKAIRMVATVLAVGIGASVATAQPGKTLREQIVGTWDFIIAEIVTQDGKKSFPFGEKPKGMLIFTAGGQFSQVHVSGDLPRIASNNRLAGTPEQNTAIVHGSLALFGTYTVDEAKKTVTFHIVSSTFPNWEGEKQTRTIDKLTADEFVNTNPNVAGGRGSASNLYRRVK
jgi:Lipocalin-like domain